MTLRCDIFNCKETLYFHYNGSEVTSPPTSIQKVCSDQKYHLHSRPGTVWKSEEQFHPFSSPRPTFQSGDEYLRGMKSCLALELS